jgi:hypothetical protein
VKTDFINRLKTMRQDLSALLEMPSAMTWAEPVRSRLSTLATSLAECEQQAIQMYKDQETHHARINTLARELAALGERAAPAVAPPADRPQTPDPSPAPARIIPDRGSPIPPTAEAPAAPAPAPAEAAAGLFIAEGVSMISRSTVSPTCEAFVFAMTDTAGSLQQVRFETYRTGGKIFVKTRSPLAGTDTGWVRGEDGYGTFFLCYEDKIASIADKKLRMAAGFALS